MQIKTGKKRSTSGKVLVQGSHISEPDKTIGSFFFDAFPAMLACNTVHEDFAKFSLHGSPMFHQERGRIAKTQDPGEDY